MSAIHYCSLLDGRSDMILLHCRSFENCGVYTSDLFGVVYLVACNSSFHSLTRAHTHKAVSLVKKAELMVQREWRWQWAQPRWRNVLVGNLQEDVSIANSQEWASSARFDHKVVKGVVYLLQGFEYVEAEVGFGCVRVGCG